MTVSEHLVGTVIAWLVTGVFGVGLFGGGLYLYRSGKYSYSQGKRAEEATPIPVSEISTDLDEIAVKGTVRPIDGEGTVDAPFSDDRAVVAHSTVSERRRSSSGTHGSNTTRKTLHSDEQAVPFLIEDETGTARIEPHEDAFYKIERESTRTSSPRERPSVVQEWIDRTGAVPDQMKGRSRRYNQKLIAEGETAFVLGEPQQTRGAADLEIVPGNTPEDMILSDMSRDDIKSSSTWSALAGGTIGLIMMALGAIPALAFVFLTLALLGELASML